MWNAISYVQDLNSCRRVHFLRRWPLHYGHIYIFIYLYEYRRYMDMEIRSIWENKTDFLPSYGCFHTVVWMHHIDDNKAHRKKTTKNKRVLTQECYEPFWTIIDETPQRPIRPIARDLGVLHTTVKACVKEDLKCRSYRPQTSQILT